MNSNKIVVLKEYTIFCCKCISFPCSFDGCLFIYSKYLSRIFLIIIYKQKTILTLFLFRTSRRDKRMYHRLIDSILMECLALFEYSYFFRYCYLLYSFFFSIIYVCHNQKRILMKINLSIDPSMEKSADRYKIELFFFRF